MKDRLRPNIAGPTEADSSTAPSVHHRVRLLDRLVRRYAWCRVPTFWPYSGHPDYLIVIQLPDGRRFWRCLASSEFTPDEIMLRWASCPPAKWAKQFHAKSKGTKLWHEFFDFWIKP